MRSRRRGCCGAWGSVRRRVRRRAAPPSRLFVEATEFRFTLSRTTVKPGPAIVELAIRGQDPHDLRLRKLGALRAQVARVH